MDNFPSDEFDKWRAEHGAYINARPDIVSLLYDLDLLPEVVATFKDRDMLRRMVLIVAHFQSFEKSLRARTAPAPA